MGRHSKQIQKPLEDMTRRALDRRKDETIDPEELFHYFMKVGTDVKGDCQSYNYESGTGGEVSLGIDAVALAVACAGVPLPHVGFFAEVGATMKIEKTENHLLVAYVAPRKLKVGTERLTSKMPVTFVDMTGWKWGGGITASAEVGIKTPDFLPGFTGGGFDEGTSVESGTYAELCAFEAGAKAGIQGEVGIQGERLFVKDMGPVFADRLTGIRKDVLEILRHGDRKTVLKAAVLDMFYFSFNMDVRKLAPEKNLFKKLLTSGGIPTSTFLKQLRKVRALPSVLADNAVLGEVDHYISALKNLQDGKVLGAYCFLSMWTAKPSAGIKSTMTAAASFSVGAGVAGARAGVEAAVTGPAVDMSYRTSRYRFQICNLVDSQGGAAPSGPSQGARIRQPYTVVTQDTRINYGQIQVDVIGVNGCVDIGASQGLVSSDRFGKAVSGSRGAEGKLGEAAAEWEAKGGPEEITGTAKAQAGKNFKVVNFVNYDSAVAYWTPPETAGVKEGELKKVRLGTGSGYSFGVSVSLEEIRLHVSKFHATGEFDAYLQGLANALNVTRKQFLTFLHHKIGGNEDIRDFLMDVEVPDSNALILEASFLRRQPDMEVDVMWRDGAWKLGPFSRKEKTLRELMIPKKTVAGQGLQSIRIRYRIEDGSSESRTRFKLGFSYIVKLGINLESIENAGSLGVVDLITCWYGRGGGSIPQEAYEIAVPPMALFFQ